MRLVIERGELLRALGHVTSVVERRTTIPILSNVLLSAGPHGLQLKATDLEREVIESVPADVSQPGAVTVPAHMLHDIVRKLPEGSQVELRRDAGTPSRPGAEAPGEPSRSPLRPAAEAAGMAATAPAEAPGGDRLTLTAGSSRFALQTLAGEDFPDLAAGELTHEFVIGAKDLKRLIDKTKFAISTEETRYYLTGIYLHTPEAQATLRAVATDGHRLAQVELPRPEGAAGMPGVIIPRKTVNELNRLVEDTSAGVKVGVSATKVRFEIGTVTLTSKLIDGTFPDYQRVIPAGNDRELRVTNATFMGAVDRVSTIASERGRAVKLSIASDKLTLSVNNPEGGSATEEIEVGYSAQPLEIGFNARYLLDIASQLEGEEAHFMLADAGAPAMVRDSGDAGALYVIMPMRV